MTWKPKPAVKQKTPRKCTKCDKPVRIMGVSSSGYCAEHLEEHQKSLQRIKEEYDYDLVLEAQGGVCAICKRPPRPDKVLTRDHSHATGKFRGLLCGSCNTGLGLFQENPIWLQEAALYLIEPNELLPFLAGRFITIKEP